MTTLLIAITLICFLLPAYVYFGYPLVLWVVSRFYPKHAVVASENLPTVSLIVSCYNEVDVIEEKLENSLKIQYPRDKFSIVVVSDGSDDGTDEIAKAYADRGVRLVRQEGRLGKTMGLNKALETIDSEIVVFSDANAMYSPDAVQQLVKHFNSPDVGYVVGAALYTDGKDSASAKNENTYWQYELAIKSWESRLHSVVGGDGAIYAIRKALWQPLDQKDINDFVNPLQIVAKGYKGRFEPTAQCFEETAGSFSKEIARKERIVNRSIRGLMNVREVMNPFRTGWFAFEVISHKLLRWLIPLFLALGLVGSAFLASQGYGIFQLVAVGGLAILIPAFLGHIRHENADLPTWVSVPYYFTMVNAYALKGLYNAFLGRTQVTWNSARQSSESKQKKAKDTSTRITALFLVSVTGLAISLGWPYV